MIYLSQREVGAEELLLSNGFDIVKNSSDLRLLILILLILSIIALIVVLIIARKYVKKELWNSVDRRKSNIDGVIDEVDNITSIKNLVQTIQTKVQKLEADLLLMKQEGTIDSDKLMIVLSEQTVAYNNMVTELREAKKKMSELIEETIRKVR